MKTLIVTLTLLALPGAAFAQGIDLSWDDCVGTGLESSNKNFVCTGTVNQNYNLIFQFKTPQSLPNFVGMTAYVRLTNTTPGPLAPFWHYENGGCNNPAVGTKGIAFFDNIQLEPNCATNNLDPWDGDGSGGFEGIAAYGADFFGPGTAYLILGDARGSATPVDPFSNYYAFHLTFNNRNRTACAGCTQGVSLRWCAAELESNDGSPMLVLTGPDKFSDCATINGAPPALCSSGQGYYRDADGDGYGDPSVPAEGPTTRCGGPRTGYVTDNTDCDDTRASVHPGVPEVCDGLDNDCNGRTDDAALGPSGLVGLWKAEGNAKDATGSNHGVLRNGTTFSAGQVGQAFTLDGIDDYVGNLGTAATFSFIQNTGIFTIEAWIKLDDPNALSERAITASTPTTAEKGHYFTWDNSTGQQRLVLSLMKGEAGNPVIASISLNQVITNSDWHHVAAVGNGTGITFYVDGTAYPGSGVMGSMPTGNSTRALDIGRCPSTSPLCQFDGQIDEAAIYDRALSASEIQAIYNAGTGGRCALVAVNDPPTSRTFSFSAWPNPASHSVDLTFHLVSGAEVRAEVFDVAGHRVHELLPLQRLTAGHHHLTWDGRGTSGRRVAPGIYLVRLSAGGDAGVQRIVLRD